MMKKFLLILAVVFCSSELFSQQTSLFTQFMFNPFALNPAVAGTYKFFQIRSTHRFQWVGFSPDAPITNSISMFGPVIGKEMGYGGTIFSDVTGPVSRSEIKGAYAYNIPLTDEIRASFGAALGLMQYKVDLSKISFSDKLEQELSKVESYFKPDGMAGIYVWTSNYQVSVSVDNLFANKFKFDADPDAIGINKLKRHFYIMGAGSIDLNRDWATEASVIFKAVYPAPLQMDLNARATYKKIAWFGVSYRTQDAISVMGGYIFNQRIYVGYSFDWNAFSSIRRYSMGTHELMLGYRFNTISKRK
jgi:type IX secretion system PorP/SprF family membrane protein